MAAFVLSTILLTHSRVGENICLRKGRGEFTTLRRRVFFSSTVVRSTTGARHTRNCISCSAEPEADPVPHEESQPRLGKFDPNSDKDAFGRDPRKETEFWMGAAKSVLESEEVQQAIEEHKADGGDGLTDEQRAYMEFIKGLDGESKKEEH